MNDISCLPSDVTLDHTSTPPQKGLSFHCQKSPKAEFQYFAILNFTFFIKA